MAFRWISDGFSDYGNGHKVFEPFLSAYEKLGIRFCFVEVK